MGIVLTGPGQRAEVAPRGAALMSWTAGGTERLSYYAPADPSHAFDGAVLVPWPNRIRDGAYDGHRLPINEPERNNALHGLAYATDWEVASREADTVTLRTTIGAPFAIETQATYRLDASGLVVELAATNRGDAPTPFGCGSHPYLAVAAAHARLELPAASCVPTDERRLPTGPPQPVQSLGPALDTCFTDLVRDQDGLARVRTGEIELWLDERFPFVHVYTGDDDPDPVRRRTRIAVEPVTCAPDAFNTGLGLLTLAPGERFSGRWGLTLNKEMT